MTESLPVAGWALTGLACVGGGADTTVNPTTGVASIGLDPGENVVCRYTNTKLGSITIVKDAIPDDAQDFAFTTSGTGLSPFTLDDDGDATRSNTITFGGLLPGAYSVTETLPVAGWDFIDLECEYGGGTSVDFPTLGTTSITLAAGDDVTCTYTNAKQASIIIVKDAVPNDVQDFAYTTSGGLSPATFTLDDDAGAAGASTTNLRLRVFGSLDPGTTGTTYTVTESLPVAGWALTGLACVGGGADTTVNPTTGVASIGLDPGENVVCRYTNTKLGSITIVKDAIPDDAQDFAFTTSGTGLSPFTLDDDGDATRSNTITFGGLLPGAYSVTETLPVAGWDLIDLGCEYGSGTSVDFPTLGTTSITLAAGDDVTCTYTNAKQASIIIVKDAVPNDVQDFAYTTSGGLSPATFTLDDDAGATLADTTTFTDLRSGRYTVTESLPVAGWTLTNLVCTGGGIDTVVNPTTGVASIGLDPGGGRRLHLHERQTRHDHRREADQARRLGAGLRLHRDGGGQHP